MTLHRDHTWAIVLAGGEGARLATLTTALYGRPLPKQFATIEGGRSMLQATLARIAPIAAPERIVVVVGPAHVELAREQLRAFEGATLLVQPASLGTAAAVLYGLAWIRAHDSASMIVMFPSDHYVADGRGFVDAVQRAAATCDRLERLVLVGTTPDRADPDYGWIVPGAPIEAGARVVERFVEKPDPAMADKLFREGALWNTFVFAAPATTLAALGRTLLPGHAERFDAWAFGGGSVSDAFRGLTAADFSRDVLQRTSDLAVARMPNVGWNDWGTPERVLASLRGTPAEQHLHGRLSRRSSEGGGRECR